MKIFCSFKMYKWIPANLKNWLVIVKTSKSLQPIALNVTSQSISKKKNRKKINSEVSIWRGRQHKFSLVFLCYYKSNTVSWGIFEFSEVIFRHIFFQAFTWPLWWQSLACQSSWPSLYSTSSTGVPSSITSPYGLKSKYLLH